MFFKYWNYTGCVNYEDISEIEANLTAILKREGFIRLDRPPQNISTDELKKNSIKLRRELAKKIWIVGLFPGDSGWTILKTQPNEFICRRGIDSQRPRLSELAMKISHEAFHYGVYDDYYGILLEVDRVGNIYTSGCHHIEDEYEKNFFYAEPIDDREAWKFNLIEIPNNIAEEIRPASAEEWQEKELALNQLSRLFELEVDTLDAEEELLVGDARKADFVLSKFITNSSLYWWIARRNLYYLAYTQEEKVKADGGKLLYFQPPECYQKLDRLSEIAAKY